MADPKPAVRESVLYWSKSTKHKHVYADADEVGAPIPTVYIEKTALPTLPPKVIRVSIEIVTY